MAERAFLAGRRALVTGSAGSLGLALAQALAESGADVMLTGLEDAAAVESTRARLEQRTGVKVFYRRADLSRSEEVTSLIGESVERLGSVDVLVNNAVVRHFDPIEKFPLEAWQRALAVNLTAAFIAVKLLLPRMRTAGYGRIFNMTSVYGSRATENRIDYVTTKTALQGFTRSVALEAAGSAVSCHALCPGAVLTEASERRIEALARERSLSREAAEHEFMEGKQPSGRFVAMQSVTDVLLLLCGPAGIDMNGAIVPLEAGWLARA